MRFGRYTLARLFAVICVSAVITPAFYAYAVSTPSQSEASESKSETATEKQATGAANASEQSALVRVAEVCTKVRASISNRTSNLQQTANRHLGVMDQIYDNATDYATINGFSITDAQKIAVASARATLTSAVQDLANSEDVLNCEDANVGKEAVALRLNVQGVEDALHSYRDAVSTVLTSLKIQANSGALQ